MCNRPEPFVVNYAHLDVFNPFPGHSNFHCQYIASLPSEIRTARQRVRDLSLVTRDGLDLAVKILELRQDIHLMYGEVWLGKDSTQGRMIRVYQKWLRSSV